MQPTPAIKNHSLQLGKVITGPLGMRKDIAEYLAKCLECQQVKIEHQHPVGLLHPLSIPKWKWDIITCDFISDLP